MKKLTIVLVALVLAGCNHLSPDRVSRIKTIGIISLVGPLRFEDSGVRKGYRPWDAATIAEWSPDSLIIDHLTQQLRGRFDVRAVAYDKSMIPPPDDDDRSGLLKVERAPDLSSVKPQGLDAYIVVMPFSRIEGGGPFSGRVLFDTVGIARVRKVFGNDDTFTMHAYYAMFVVDGRTGSTIALETAEGAAVSRNVDKSWWADSAGALPKQQAQQLHEAIEAMLAQSLATTLQRINFLS